ncbi:GNAT family N-acetyltransferase [Paenisporosarcina sp. TG-14]|uniref:GNAT family N-acetyltransferase n=1 Tax=Paenisporosarcina sp. TG-14 TaxID=1231057 RepID=UPI00031BEBB4|nr:GNAT family N-acetyltransferase [Paenisporosarcina sp. TG-14]
MKIRKLIGEDAEVYWNLRLEALQQNPEAFATTYEDAISRLNPLKRVASNLDAIEAATLGVFIDNDLVGIMTIAEEGAPKLRHRLNLFAVYVTPRVRGKQIGSALLHAVINHAKELQHVEKINLTVVSTNIQAIRLYEKAGFVAFGIEQNAMKTGDTYVDEVYMSLEW